jgi:hypothetical protein
MNTLLKLQKVSQHFGKGTEFIDRCLSETAQKLDSMNMDRWQILDVIYDSIIKSDESKQITKKKPKLEKGFHIYITDKKLKNIIGGLAMQKIDKIVLDTQKVVLYRFYLHGELLGEWSYKFTDGYLDYAEVLTPTELKRKNIIDQDTKESNFELLDVYIQDGQYGLGKAHPIIDTIFLIDKSKKMTKINKNKLVIDSRRLIVQELNENGLTLSYDYEIKDENSIFIDDTKIGKIERETFIPTNPKVNYVEQDQDIEINISI